MSCVLVVGGGGREHALAWTLSRSERIDRLLVAPGNPGTAACDRAENVATSANDIAGLVALCRRESVGLAVIGPEGPLAAGIVDALASAGVAAFGPSAACARLEASKAYCKQFLIDNQIPTAAAEVFGDADAALARLASRPDLPVVKASGLAAGKGVVVPETRAEAAAAVRAMLVDGRFGPAGEQILLEERLWGREVSVLAFCDGERFAVLPPAQDHKRLREGDHGPNTGGMGAFAPSPAVDDRLIERIGRQVIAPTLAALGRAGTPYRGLLYAGLMITADGPKVIEFNCRFGDPETQAVLPLLRSDLFEIMAACATGLAQRRLHRVGARGVGGDRHGHCRLSGARRRSRSDLRPRRRPSRRAAWSSMRAPGSSTGRCTPPAVGSSPWRLPAPMWPPPPTGRTAGWPPSASRAPSTGPTSGSREPGPTA